MPSSSYANPIILNALAKGYDPLEREEKFLDLQLKKQRFSGIEEDADWERQKRRIAMEDRPYKNAQDAISDLINTAPLVTYENYPAMAERAIRRGVPRGIFRDPQSFKNEEDFNAWKDTALTSMKDRLAEFNAQSGRMTAEAHQTSAAAQFLKSPKYSVHYESDDEGNVTRIVTDESGEIVRQGKLGKIGKTKEGKAPSDFDKKFGIARIIAKDQLKREPSMAEIADAYRQKFGTASLLSDLLGGNVQTGGAGQPRPAPKF